MGAAAGGVRRAFGVQARSLLIAHIWKKRGGWCDRQSNSRHYFFLNEKRNFAKCCFSNLIFFFILQLVCGKSFMSEYEFLIARARNSEGKRKTAAAGDKCGQKATFTII